MLWNVHLLDRFWLICNHGAIQCNIHLFSVNSFIFVIINNYFSNMTWTQWFPLKIKICSNNLFQVIPKLTKWWEFTKRVRSCCGCSWNPRKWGIQLGFWNRLGPATQTQGYWGETGKPFLLPISFSLVSWAVHMADNV